VRRYQQWRKKYRFAAARCLTLDASSLNVPLRKWVSAWKAFIRYLEKVIRRCVTSYVLLFSVNTIGEKIIFLKSRIRKELNLFCTSRCDGNQHTLLRPYANFEISRIMFVLPSGFLRQRRESDKHSIDYFASQNRKHSMEDFPLGKATSSKITNSSLSLSLSLPLSSL